MRRWLYVSGIAFLVAIITSVVFLVWGQKWFLPGPDKAILYLLILVPLALACALMLFKVMRSYANYKGTYQNHQLELAGPVVVFMLLIGTGYYFYQHPPPKDHNSLTIYFTNLDEPAKKLTGTARVNYKSDIRNFDVFDGTIIYPDADPGTPIFIAYNLSGVQHADTFMVPAANIALQVTVHMNSALNEEKKELVAKLLIRLNTYCTGAQNFAAFMEEDMERAFNGDEKYWDDLMNHINTYNAGRDSLFAIKDNLINSLRPFLGAKTQELVDLFSDFVDGHKNYFKSFNDAYRNDLIKFSTGKLDKQEQQKLIDDARKTGRLAINWLSTFQEKINKIEQLISTT